MKTSTILLADYQSSEHYMTDEETLKRNRVKKAIQYVQNKHMGRDVRRKARKSYSNSLLFLGAYLKEHGFNAIYVSLPEEETLFQNALKTCDIAYFTATTPVVPLVARYIESAKSISPNMQTVLGGFHASALPEQTLNEIAALDFIAIGEAETTVRKLMDGFPFDTIGGLAYRNGGQVIIQGKGIQLAEDEIPAPDYSLLNGDKKRYRYNLQFTFGCKYRCKYCVNGYFWNAVRTRTDDSIRKELLSLKQILGNQFEIHVVDNIISLNPQLLQRIAKIRNELGLEISFTADIRAEHVQDIQTVQWMEEMGIVKVFMGFEDAELSQRIHAGRTTSTESMIQSLTLIRDHSHIKADCYWMLGLPGTSTNSIRRNARFVAWLIEQDLIEFICPDIIFVPLPGTPFFHNAEHYGITISETDWLKFQRSNYHPVFRLETITQDAMYSALLDFDLVVIDAALKKLKMQEAEVLEQYFLDNGGSSVESFLMDKPGKAPERSGT